MPQTMSISTQTLKRKVSSLLMASLTRTKFVPTYATQDFKRWMIRLELTSMERKAVENTVKEILKEHERRVRWIKTELDREVFHIFGGD